VVVEALDAKHLLVLWNVVEDLLEHIRRKSRLRCGR
jgi:hypothetical protein